MSENGVLPGEDLQEMTLWARLLVGWYYVLGGAVLGVAGAGLAIAFLPATYEAIAVIQVGQIGQIGQVAQNTPLLVEPPAQAVERMKAASFQFALAQSLGDQEWSDALSRSPFATTKYLSVQILRATVTAPLIELKARAGSPERAKTIAEAAVAELARRQADISKPVVDKMSADLAITKEKLASAERELEKLEKISAMKAPRDDQFTQVALIASLYVQKQAEVYAARQAIMAYETALLPPATQSARAIEAPFVADKPVSPNRILLIVGGLVGGLLVGALSALLVDAWRRVKRIDAGEARM
ncbi:hypothetical protein [Accumulibacter sp.]|uniref:hypothetical protein n=1 Tax=Accumulibacter sp. TaxID=2053492 RepID=UPI0026283371|nr:hypothetical protein [Accumulibacter sp.]